MADIENAENKTNGRKILYIVILVLFLFNVFLVIKLIRNNITKEKLISTTELKDELQKEVNAFKIQLEEYENLVGEKDTTLVAKQKQIEELQLKIEEEIKAGKLTKARYNAAKEEIAQLKYYTKKYQEEIQELKRKNERLTEENEGLKTQVTDVKREVDKLMDENVDLSNKVSLGAMLRTSAINVVGIQIKGSKQRESMKGERIEGLRITFSLMDNNLAKIGKKEFFIKIVNPKGETLFLEERGSGYFTYQGEQTTYTVKSDFEFSNSPAEVYRVYWGKGSPFEKGNYKVQLFNEGLKIGEGNFEIQ